MLAMPLDAICLRLLLIFPSGRAEQKPLRPHHLAALLHWFESLGDGTPDPDLRTS